MKAINPTDGTFEIFKQTASKLLADFYNAWKPSFTRDKILFNEGSASQVSATCYKLITVGVNVDTLKKFNIIIAADLSTKPYSEHSYTISMYVDSSRIHNFKQNDFDPTTLISNFHSFFKDIMCISIGDELQLAGASGLNLLFNHKMKLMSANISMSILKDGVASRGDHLIYHYSDHNVLRSNRLVRTGTINYRNFKFLWDYTNIKSIIGEDIFLTAYRSYSSDVVRYHELLKMERI